MSVELTTMSDKLLCEIYKHYLTRLSNNISKEVAQSFSNDELGSVESFLLEFNGGDYEYYLEELNKQNLIAQDIIGNFIITDEAIVYMQKRFKNGIKDLVSFVSRLNH